MAFKLVIVAATPEQLQAQIRELAASWGPPSQARPTRNPNVFRSADLDALSKLADAPNGLTTDQFCALLKLPNASLPPVLNGWNRRAKKRDLSVNDLFHQERFNTPDGRKNSIYRLTEVGRQILNAQLAAEVENSEGKICQHEG
jgi:hypothetical protein